MTEDWEHFPHDADVGVRGFGATAAEAFENAAVALTAVVTDPATVAADVAVSISCAAPDRELLLAEWLNAVIYEMATRHMLFRRYHVSLRNNTLSATAWGEALDVARHQPAAEAKGATLTALSVAVSGDGRWQAQCVVDV